MRRVAYLLSFVLALLAPLQSFAAASPMPCHDSSHRGEAGAHDHGGVPVQQHEQSAHHACAACAACCAGAAISCPLQVAMDLSVADPAATPPTGSLSGPAPTRLDRPPQ